MLNTPPPFAPLQPELSPQLRHHTLDLIFRPAQVKVRMAKVRPLLVTFPASASGGQLWTYPAFSAAAQETRDGGGTWEGAARADLGHCQEVGPAVKQGETQGDPSERHKEGHGTKMKGSTPIEYEREVGKKGWSLGV